MDLTKGGCSRGSTQCAPGLRLNAVQPARNRVGVVPCTVPPTSTNASNNLECLAPRHPATKARSQTQNIYLRTPVFPFIVHPSYNILSK